MSDCKFRPPLWIYFYLAIIPNLAWLILIPIIIKLCYWHQDILPIIKISALFLTLLIPALLFFILLTYFSSLIKVTKDDLSVINFGIQSELAKWSEIYRVEPYRYFGLRFLLVRHHSSDNPLWLPLFLKKQHQLNLLILGRTRQDNPLHIVLLQRDKFKHVPWHSKARKYKSDRYILETAYTDKIRFSFKKYCLLLLSLSVAFLIPFYLLIEGVNFNFDYLTMVGISVLFLAFIFLLIWQLGFKNNYIAIKDNSIEVNIELLRQVNRCNIPWSHITKVEYYNLGIFSELRIFSSVSLYSMNYTPIRVFLIDLNKFKSSVIKKTHPEHPLHQAVIKYF